MGDEVGDGMPMSQRGHLIYKALLDNSQPRLHVQEGGTSAQPNATPLATKDKAVKHVSSCMIIIYTFSKETGMILLANSPEDLFYFKESSNINSPLSV